MQFDCTRCDELLLDFAYGELDEVTAAAFRRHADACGRCNAALADVRAVREAFSMLPLEAPSPIIDARILAAADQRLAEIDDRNRAALRHESRSILSKLFDVFRVAALRPQYAMAFLLVLVVGVGLVVAPQMRLSERAPGVAPDIAIRNTNEVAPVTITPSAPAAAPEASAADGMAAQSVLPQPPGRGTAEGALAEEAERSGALGQSRRASGGDGMPADAPVERARRERAPLAIVAEPTPAPQRMLTRGGGGRDRSVDEDESGALGFTQTPAEMPALAAPGRPRQAVADSADGRRDEQEGRRQSEERAWAQAPSPAPAARPPVQLVAPSQPAATSSQGGLSAAPGPSPTRSAAAEQQQQRMPAGAGGVAAGGDAYARGMSSYRAGQFRQALPDLESAIARPGLTTDALGNAYLAIARSYYRIQSYAEAARRYEELLRRFSTYRASPDVNWEAAECHRFAGNTQRADQLYRVAERSSAYGERARARRVQMDAARRAAPAFDAMESEPAAAESGSAAH